MIARLSLFSRVIGMIAVYNIVIGLGTLEGYSGRPHDAPHLHLSDELRGWIWVATAVAALAILVGAGRGPDMLRAQRLALSLLQIMPTVRGVSHAYAWVLSWPVWEIAPGPRRWWQEGSAAGWYTAAPSLGEVTLIITLAWFVGRYGRGAHAGSRHRSVDG